MPLRGQNFRWNPWCLAAIVLIVAVAALGIGGYQSGARAQPAALVDFLKKKAAKAKSKDAVKKGALPGKGAAPGSKGVIRGTPGTPKNAVSKAPGAKELTKGGAPKGSPKGPTSAALPKGAGPKGAVPKGATTSALPKGASPKGAAPKGTTTSALPKGANPKGAGLPKGAGPKGTTTAALPKGASPKGLTRPALPKGAAFSARSSPRFAATAPERLRLRVDHRVAIAAAQRLLPRYPLPGERGFTGVPPTSERRYVSTELVLRIAPNVSRQTLDETARRLGLTTISTQEIGITGGTIYHFRLAGNRQVADVVRNLETQNIGVAQPNYTYRLFQEEAPPAAESEKEEAPPDASSEKEESIQYVIGKLHLEEVHKVATGNNVLIAVIDSAIDVAHPDLAGTVVEQYDAVGSAEKPHPHGTGMVGAIVAHQRLMGIAPGAKILAVRAFSAVKAQSPAATTRNILSGIEWAAQKGARVINMSFAGPQDPMLQVALKNAHAKGIVLIAASGNLGPKSPPLFPASDPNVIAVTATDENDQLYDQAVRGPHLAVAAPGVDVMVPSPEESYQLTTGTSVAAAHVSGVAALLIERHPEASAAIILEVLTASATHPNPKGRDNLFGWGLVDPAAALAELDSRMEDSKVATTAAPAARTAQPAAVRPAAARQPAARPLAPAPASAPR